jgi:hypothetical protein
MTERRIETAIEIDAPPSQVWTLLTDFARMPAWNPFIQSISGSLMKALDYRFTSYRPASWGCDLSLPSFQFDPTESCGGWDTFSLQEFSMASTTFCSNPSCPSSDNLRQMAA